MTFTVYIAEKPSVGNALAGRLAQRSPQMKRSRTMIEGRDWAVCWLSGHVLRQAEPDYYIQRQFPEARRDARGSYPWSWETLPILPALSEWKLEPDRSKSDLLATVKELVRRADVVVHAGDIDREGQLLVDEVLEYIGCRRPVRRILPTANDDRSIDRALSDVRDNAAFQGMRDAARARSWSDWLVGMNYSRAVTVRGQECGSRGYTSIGRVQTPILGIIVRRELEIANFKPVDYFAISVVIAAEGGAFRARWVPQKGQAGLDEAGRLVDRKVAEGLRLRVEGKTGVVAEYRDENRRENAPLPFAIQDLQKLAARKFGIGLDKTLEIVQSLYEQHKAVTYPRSDCNYLPTSQHADAPYVLGAVRANLPEMFGSVAVSVDASRKSSAFNDAKVTAHHAIIPTGERIDTASLSSAERLIYEEICKRYVAQFMPPHVYRAVSVRVDVAGEQFTANGRTTVDPGWKAVEGTTAAPARTERRETGEDEDENTHLPPMRQGDAVKCTQFLAEEKKTTPPPRFTDETLLDAMLNIHKFCDAEPIRQHFLETLKRRKAENPEDTSGVGIGTPATRHTFAPKLIEVGLIEAVPAGGRSKQKAYKPTDAGIAIVQALPRMLTTPDTSAVWDMAFSKIEAGEITLAEFMASQERQIRKTLDVVRELQIQLPTRDPSSGSRGGRAASRRAAGGSRRAASSAAAAVDTAGPCEKCGSGVMRKKVTAHGAFYGCSNYPQCRHTKAAAAQCRQR